MTSGIVAPVVSPPRITSTTRTWTRPTPTGPDNVYGSDEDEGWYPRPVLDDHIGVHSTRAIMSESSPGQDGEIVFPPRGESISEMLREVHKCEAQLELLASIRQYLRETRPRREEEEGHYHLGLVAIPGGSLRGQLVGSTLSAEDPGCLQKLDEKLAKAETKLAITRMLFDAVAFGFAGRRGLG